ncbi:ATP-binding protein [Candidatus Poribacteria bacterium]
MFADDLFKKLKPIMGEELFPLQAVYMAGDDEDKRNVERVLRVVYSNTITGIHPPSSNISSGKYLLGTVISGDKALHPFSLRDEDWFHVGIFGQTGRGKTNAMLHLLQTLKNRNIPWLVFDWKRAGYRDLLSVYRNIQIFTVGRDVSPFYLNPLTPPPGVDNITWYKQFIQCISHAYFLGHGCEVILQDVIGKDTVTLIDLLKRLQTYPAKWRKLQWLQSTERAVKALCYGGISNVLNVKTCPPISSWLDRNTVFELDALTDSEAKFLVNIMMSQIYLYRKEHRHRGLQHVSVIEEAHNVLKKEPENVEAKSVMDKIFREIREYGESLVIIDQMPSTILDSAIANTATQMTLSLKHNNDVRAAGNAMLLDRDEQLFLGKLPVGTAIVKLQNRWHAPFMIRFPYVPIQAGKVDDGAIKAKMQGYFTESEAILPEIQQPQDISVISDADKEEKKLLVSIAEEPLLGIAERYRTTFMNPRSGNQCKRNLIELGLIKEVSIRISNGRIKLLEPTDKGMEELKEYGYSRSWRHGGVEHLYWVRQVRKRLESKGYKVKEEYPIGNGETVDLAIIGKNKKIAIEIETGKSDAVGNIRKCLAAGFEVVSVATNERALQKMESEACRLSGSELRKVRLKCRTC